MKNQHQQVLWYLINWNEFSLKDIINDSMFYKFQSRLSDIELEHGTITEKTKEKFVNRFGRKSQYTLYKCTNKELAKQLLTQSRNHEFYRRKQ